MSGVWQVAFREIRERGRSKAYLITSGVVLLLVIALVVVPRLLGDDSDTYSLGLLGEGNEPIVTAAELLANANDAPDDPPSVKIETTEYSSRSDAEADLEAGVVDAVLIDGEEVLVERAAGFTGSPLLRLLQRGAATVELEQIVAEEGQAATEVIEVMTSDPLVTTTLTGEDAADETGGIAAYAGLLLLYIAILLYGTWILTGVTEEKTNRVVEVLLSSLRPWQLLAGKIVGIGTLGIAQFASTVIVAVVAVQATDTFDIPSISGETIFNLILWFVLGFLIFAFMFGAAGSLVSRQEDAQSIAMPMTISAVGGFFLSMTALNDPDGIGATIGTFVPITAPFVVPVRAALNAIPLWQYGLSVLLAIAAVIGLVFVGGRIYAGGVLRYGKKVGFREAWRSARE
jgi:ABC-2 type transport system permease protein